MLLAATIPCQCLEIDATIVLLFRAGLEYMRLIIGMSGASGVIYGIRLLEVLQEATDIETHLSLIHI